MSKSFSYLVCLPLALAITSTACSSSDDDSPSGPVSFRNNVAPILQNSCAFSSCHAAGTTNGVVFAGDPAAVRTSLVNVKAPQLPTMNFVTPGDPGQSYIMHKLDGDQKQFAAGCSSEPDCGSQMPLGQPQLPESTRNTIRRWISEGAADN
ncbi:hypothetical protein LZC95_15850 [Pendulispora brunnea]|uniref:Cytochrome C Planctomycete-type domain-containing protein n=1 Tax=Pendulispora brunnea TaxID=2905690 RepID=A0ABZ2KMJ9_9BACT